MQNDISGNKIMERKVSTASPIVFHYDGGTVCKLSYQNFYCMSGEVVISQGSVNDKYDCKGTWDAESCGKTYDEIAAESGGTVDCATNFPDATITRGEIRSHANEVSALCRVKQDRRELNDADDPSEPIVFHYDGGSDCSLTHEGNYCVDNGSISVSMSDNTLVCEGNWDSEACGEATIAFDEAHDLVDCSSSTPLNTTNTGQLGIFMGAGFDVVSVTCYDD